MFDSEQSFKVIQANIIGRGESRIFIWGGGAIRWWNDFLRVKDFFWQKYIRNFIQYKKNGTIQNCVQNDLLLWIRVAKWAPAMRRRFTALHYKEIFTEIVPFKCKNDVPGWGGFIHKRPPPLPDPTSITPLIIWGHSDLLIHRYCRVSLVLQIS